MADYPYAGRIKNTGQQQVKAPNIKKDSGGKSVVHKGGDLRTGKTGR